MLSERRRQDTKWGPQHHGLFTWLAILGEEVGEANEAALHQRFGGPEQSNFKAEIIHVAAVALAILEDLERNGDHDLG